MTIYVDHTHLGRHVTGLERITLELFSPAGLAPLDDDANRYREVRLATSHATISLLRTGRPVSKFCGFMRRTLSAPIARIR